MNLFNGLRVIQSELCTVATPTRRSRSKRIQKKFIKKFGYKHVPGVMEAPGMIIMHPEIFSKFKKELNNGRD